MNKPMPSNKKRELAKRFLRRAECEPLRAICPAGRDKDLCNPHTRKKAKPVTRNTLQGLEIGGLKQELAELRKLLDMLLVLVDPEDVRAAVGLLHSTPRNAELRKLVQPSDSPDEHFDGDDERPW